LEASKNVSEGMYSVLKCHNKAKYTEFYLEYLRFIVTSNGNAGRFKNSFTMIFQMFKVLNDG
jgi:hypothetical protein